MQGEQAGFSTAKPWLPIPAGHRARAVDVQDVDRRSVLAFYREALAFRRGCAPTRCGDIDFVETSEHILAFTRRYRGETVLCLYNLSREPVDWLLPTAFTSAIVDPISAPGITLNRKKARLPGRSWAFLR